MKYDDLLNIPFRRFGRDKSGFDCYGLALECCRRAGTPLRDIRGGLESLPSGSVNDYISGGLNVRETKKPRTGGLVCTSYRGNVHIGYIVGRNLVLHATIDKGVKVSPLEAMGDAKYYEVTDESDIIQGAVEPEDAGGSARGADSEGGVS